MSFVVTIDGPAAAGKSTTARAVASRLGFLYVDTGALYRALALKVLEQGLRPEDPEAVVRMLSETRLELGGTPEEPRVTLDGQDVTGRIRTPDVSEMSSRLAALPEVRRGLIEIQRRLREEGPLVAEGRDLGTVVYPDADVKIFLDASMEVRARRRFDELRGRDIAVTSDQVVEDLGRRDARDRDRAESPLKPAPDAVTIDTTALGLEGQILAVVELVQRHPRAPVSR